MVFINDAQIKALPKDKKAYHKDGLCKNLYLHMNLLKNNGVSLHFYFRFNKNNKIHQICIGKYPNISLANARVLANELNFKLES
ncbi:MAG: Arm DNA-binding domain-containing protein [Helicobacteraceae bacterium]|nr:Arm DNA-binding domain-containing protein [Helicobacteraceae bacterium]